MPRVVYCESYNIGFFGLERLHPFDSRKYGRAWRQLRKHFGRRLSEIWLKPDRPVLRSELELIHQESYLERLRNSKYVASALEVPIVARLPSWLLDLCVLRPMRWATRGTVLAAKECLQHGFALNLGGGYHHAKPNQGEGFCVYSDIAIAVTSLRAERLIGEEDRVVYVDTDAHQGNGVCHIFADDDRVFIFDVYNSQIYPLTDLAAQDRIDCAVRVTSGITDREYLNEFHRHLPGFLDSVGNKPIGLAIYNAGNDVVAGDPLGMLNLSPSTVIERDLYVVKQLRQRKIPTLVLPSGGYTKQSYRLLASSVTRLLESEDSW